MPFLLLYWKYIAAAAVIGLGTIWYNAHVDGLIHAAVTKAVTERDADWRASEARAVQAEKDKAALKEKDQAQKFAALQGDFTKEKTRADQAESARLAAVRAGSRLRIATGCTSTADVPGAATPAPGSNAPPAAQFLGESDSAFLIGEAVRANKIVRQLNLCQSTLLAERK